MKTFNRIIISGFGTPDLDWFSAAEAYLNTLFEIFSKNAPNQAKELL